MTEQEKARSWRIAGGVGVLVVTGLVGLQEFFASGSMAYKIADVGLLVILLAAAWLLARFISAHGDEIGEARFDTTNKSDQNG